MLDRAFQAKFFGQIDALTDAELDEKIETVQTVSLTFNRETEAAADSKFMLRHLRRIRGERLFGQKAAAKH